MSIVNNPASREAFTKRFLEKLERDPNRANGDDFIVVSRDGLTKVLGDTLDEFDRDFS